MCRVVVLLSRDRMERANSISIGRLPGRSVDVHPPNGSYPSLPSTTVFRKPIESVGRIFRVAISAANNTTRRRHYVKRLAELTATLGGSGQIFSLEVSSLTYHSIIRIPGHNGCLGNRASGKESIGHSCDIQNKAHETQYSP